MIKVIASDMDGTLLGNDHKVAPETLKAIHEACDAGIRFMIATGRNFIQSWLVYTFIPGLQLCKNSFLSDRECLLFVRI